ncbi:MAG: chitobiase/beta-hexosaminidase C-terminal domain-containing protein [Akkermansiaceae bacterium]
MKKSHYFKSFLLIASILSGQLSNAQTLSVTCPVLPSADGGTRGASRPAEFNWNFESSNGDDVQIGQYACGSYWVAPAVGDTGVKVVSLSGSSNPDQVDLLSLDADPITEQTGLLDGSNNYGNYDSTEDELPQLPKVFSPAAQSCISLVAAMQRNESQTGGSGTSSTNGESADAYNVVTILAEAPANNGVNHIRPNITGASKELLTWDDFDLNLLGSTDIPDELTASEIEAMRQAWVHNTEIFGFAILNDEGDTPVFSEGGRGFRAHLTSDEYASGMASGFYESIIQICNSQNTLEEKKPAIAAMLAYGLDSYHCKFNYGTTYPKLWNSGAGQWIGQYAPIVFLAALSNQQEKKETVKRVAGVAHSEDTIDRGPQILNQIKRGQSGVLLWGDAHVIVRDGSTDVTLADRRYWADFKESNAYIGAPEAPDTSVGKKTSADPYGFIDGPANAPGILYMQVTAGGFQGFAACMIIMPEFRNTVGTDNPIEYADRIRRFGTWAAPDPIAAVDQRDLACSPYHYGISQYIQHNCNLEYWRTTWGPSAADPSIGIENGIGRFDPNHYHGTPVSASFSAPTVNANWNTIIAQYDGEKYESHVVDLSKVTRPDVIIANGIAYISTGTHHTNIYYTLDGSLPSETSTPYTDPFTIPEGSTLKVIALKEGKTDSDIYTVSLDSALQPQEIDARFQMLSIRVLENSNTLEINYLRSDDLSEVTYVVEHSSDLDAWDDAENVEVTSTPHSTNTDLIKAETPLLDEENSHYYRLRLSTSE